MIRGIFEARQVNLLILKIVVWSTALSVKEERGQLCTCKSINGMAEL